MEEKMKRFLGKRSVAVLSAFIMMLSIVSVPTAAAFAASPGEAKLASLSVQAGGNELLDSFSPDNFSYTVDVVNSVDSVDIVAVPQDEGAEISGAGTFSASVGENSYDVICTLGDITNIYHVKVIRADAPSETSAVDIAAIPGVTVPVKDEMPVTEITATAQYTGTVSWDPADYTFAAGIVYTATITLTPAEGYTLTGVTENFFTVAGADPVSNAADSGVITAVFPSTAADTLDNDCSLKSLSVDYDGINLPLDREFDPEVTEYSLTVHNWVNYLNINVEANSPYAEVMGSGEYTLEYGVNTINIEVYAQDGSWQGYNLTVTRPTPLEEGNVYRTDDGFIYEDRGSYLAIMGYEGDAEDIIIPAEITVPGDSEATGVTAIADKAFSYNYTMTSVAFPSGITYIGDEAFLLCIKLQNVTLPEGLKSLGKASFSGCLELESVTFPEGLISIKWAAFSGCFSLGNVTLPNSLEELDMAAFNQCTSFTSFTLPQNVTLDLYGAFLGGCTSLETISAGDNPNYTVVDGALLSADGTQLIKYPSARVAAEYEIPDGVVSLCERAFESCSFESVTIPEGVTEITWNAFDTCKNLISVSFPHSLEQIQGYAFGHCTSLTSVTLPESLYYVDGAAFAGCVSLSGIFVADGNEYYTSIDGVIYSYDEEKDEDILVIFPAGKAASFTVPGFVDVIGEWAFDESLLTSIDLGNVSFISNYAFNACDYLSSVTAGAGLDGISSGSFSFCKKLTAFYFLGNAPEIYDDGYSLFDGCSPYLTIYYASGATGFSNPWQGHPSVAFNPSYKCMVTYNLSGAPGAIPAVQVYTGGKAVQPLDPSWAGHKFLGWFKNASCTSPWNFGTNKVTAGITLYAGWAQEDNAYLDSLYAVKLFNSMYDAGKLTFNREFNPKVYSYTAKLEESFDAFVVHAEPAYEGAVVTIDGEAEKDKIYYIQKGQTIKSKIVVTSGALKKTYTLTVTRAKSTINTLSGITYSAGVLDPEFDSDVTSYNLTLDEHTRGVTITPVKSDSLSKLYIDGYLKTSKTYNVDTGHSRTCTIKVVSQSGAVRKYTVKITRDKSTNASLSNIKTNYSRYKVSPAFTAANTDYTLYLPSSVSSVRLYAVKENKDASTTFINGAYSWRASYKTFSVAYGAQKDITIRVTAQDKTTIKEYTVRIIRAPRIYKFSASPKPHTYAELSPGGDNVMTFKWTQYGPGDVKIEVNDGTDWHPVYTGNNAKGAHTATWNGSVEGSTLPVGTYKARISVTNFGAASPYKYLYIKIKPAPAVTLTASPASIVQGGTQRAKITVRWNVVTNIKVEVYDSADTLVATLFSKQNQYSNTKYWYWYGLYDTAHGGTAADPGVYKIRVTAGSVTREATVTVTPAA